MYSIRGAGGAGAVEVGNRRALTRCLSLLERASTAVRREWKAIDGRQIYPSVRGKGFYSVVSSPAAIMYAMDDITPCLCCLLHGCCTRVRSISV